MFFNCPVLLKVCYIWDAGTCSVVGSAQSEPFISTINDPDFEMYPVLPHYRSRVPLTVECVKNAISGVYLL